MKKILFLQHHVGPPGGAAGVGTAMLDVLKSYGVVHLLTLSEFVPQEVDEYYGTSLSGADIRPVRIDDTLLRWWKRFGLPSGLLTLHATMRAGKRYLREYPDFDLVCTAWDEVDLGHPALQYIHFPWNLYPRPDAPPGWEKRWFLRALIRLNSYFCQCYSGFRPRNVYRNLTLVNSNWTGEKARETYPELQYVVMHPPALADKISGDTISRGERFLSIGRCSREKRWLELIEIVERLRGRGHEVGLTLAGSRDRADYEAEVEGRMARAGHWVERRSDFSRDELHEMLRTHRYGLHGMLDEHYGMAVAELILGGCLTSVHDDGGQVEIVTNPRLRYRSIDDAVEKWDAVLSNETLRDSLLEEQMKQRDHLGRERFAREFDTLVRRLLERGVEGVKAELEGNLLPVEERRS